MTHGTWTWKFWQKSSNHWVLLNSRASLYKNCIPQEKKPTSKQTYWFSLNPFSGERTWCNGRTTPKSFEFGIYNFTIFINSDLRRQDNIKFKLHAKWCHTGKQFRKLQYNYLSQSLVIKCHDMEVTKSNQHDNKTRN